MDQKDHDVNTPDNDSALRELIDDYIRTHNVQEIIDSLKEKSDNTKGDES